MRISAAPVQGAPRGWGRALQTAESYTSMFCGPGASLPGGLAVLSKFPSKGNFRFLFCSLPGRFLEPGACPNTEDLSSLPLCSNITSSERPSSSTFYAKAPLCSPIPSLFYFLHQTYPPRRAGYEQFLLPTPRPQTEAPRQSGLYFVHNHIPVPRIAPDQDKVRRDTGQVTE